MKYIFILFIVLFLQAFSYGYNLKSGIDLTKENLSNDQHYTTINVYTSSRIENNVILGNFQSYQKNGAIDSTFSIGGYYNGIDRLYIFSLLSFTPNSVNVSKDSLEFEAGYNLVKPLILVFNYKYQEFSQDTVNTYTPGFDYYFSFPAWMIFRFYSPFSSSGAKSSACLLKLFYEFNPRLRTYVGYASGSEAYRDNSTSSIFSFTAQTPMAGLQYTFSDLFIVKLDLSHQRRDNGVTNTIFNIGNASIW